MSKDIIDYYKNNLKESINDLLLAFNRKEQDASEANVDAWVEVRDKFIEDLEDLAINVNLDMEEV